MLKDEVGGAATNLIPSDTPSDIYSEVAKACEIIIARDAAKGIEEAINWAGKVSRSIAKRPTMTLPYGAGRYGFSDQILSELAKLSEAKRTPYLDGDAFRNATYLAGVMEEAIGNVVVKAKEAMDWLKEVAKVAAKDGLPIHWTTPSGFLVYQDYRKLSGIKLDSQICGVRTQLTLQVDTDKLDARKQAQGIAPNFVHSMDASHLVLTIDRCVDNGVTSLAMVHDSYGTHAADAEALSYHLREAFIEQYSAYVLRRFLDNLKKQLPEKPQKRLPKPPTFGRLDLSSVRDSMYFFA
jgi:DNA-directed RNA polymerase